MILFQKHIDNIYLYSLKNDDTHIPNQQLCTRFVHSFFLYKISNSFGLRCVGISVIENILLYTRIELLDIKGKKYEV